MANTGAIVLRQLLVRPIVATVMVVARRNRSYTVVCSRPLRSYSITTTVVRLLVAATSSYTIEYR